MNQKIVTVDGVTPAEEEEEESDDEADWTDIDEEGEEGDSGDEMGMYGFTRDEEHGLLCQGVKPWEDDAHAVLAALRGNF